jgi:hypothetical protein
VEGRKVVRCKVLSYWARANIAFVVANTLRVCWRVMVQPHHPRSGSDLLLTFSTLSSLIQAYPSHTIITSLLFHPSLKIQPSPFLPIALIIYSIIHAGKQQPYFINLIQIKDSL